MNASTITMVQYERLHSLFINLIRLGGDTKESKAFLASNSAYFEQNGVSHSILNTLVELSKETKSMFNCFRTQLSNKGIEVVY